MARNIWLKTVLAALLVLSFIAVPNFSAFAQDRDFTKLTVAELEQIDPNSLSKKEARKLRKELKRKRKQENIITQKASVVYASRPELLESCKQLGWYGLKATILLNESPCGIMSKGVKWKKDKISYSEDGTLATKKLLFGKATAHTADLADGSEIAAGLACRNLNDAIAIYEEVRAGNVAVVSAYLRTKRCFEAGNDYFSRVAVDRLTDYTTGNNRVVARLSKNGRKTWSPFK